MRSAIFKISRIIPGFLITGSLVLGKPIYLYMEGKKAEGIKLLFYTIISLAVILAIVILAYLGLR